MTQMMLHQAMALHQQGQLAEAQALYQQVLQAGSHYQAQYLLAVLFYQQQRLDEAAGAVDAAILNPRDTWADKAAYDAQARKLVGMFRENFRKFEAHVGPDVLQAAPELAEAAE